MGTLMPKGTYRSSRTPTPRRIKKVTLVKKPVVCPRCKGTHKVFVFKDLMFPIVLHQWIVSSRWALCPARKEPVFEAELEPILEP